MIIYRAAAACALVFEMTEKCGIHLPAVPLGGSAMAQLGVVFGVAFVLSEGQESALHFSQSLRRGLCRFVRALRDFRRELVAVFRSTKP